MFVQLRRIARTLLGKSKPADPASTVPIQLPEFEGRQFFFLHIPKTAGTSFRVELERHFDNDTVFPNQTLRREIGGYPPFSYLNALSQKQFDSIKLICGHYQYREAIERFSEPPLILIMMRDPFSRCISECMHILRHDSHDMRLLLPSDPSITDIVNSHDVMHYLANVVSMMLLPDLSEAKKLIENSAFVGIQERMQESSRLLADTFGWQVDNITASNIAPKSQQSILQELSPEVLALFHKVLEPEYQLYRHACEVFEARLAQSR